MIKSSSAYLLFYRRRSATVREYEQRPREEESIEPTRRGFMEPTSSRGIMLAAKDDDDDPYMWDKPGRSSPLVLHAKETEDFSSWGKREDSPYDEWGKPGPEPDTMMILDAGVDSDGYGWPKSAPGGDSDADDLPPYNDTSGRTSPLSFMSDKRRGSDLEDEGGLPSASGVSEYLKAGNDRRLRSPGLSTCASDGSNPGTANASPRGPSPEPLVSEISRDGGRIDDSDTEGVTKSLAESGERSLASNGQIGAEAGIPTPRSATASSGTVEDDAEDDGQNEVDMVGWNERRLNGQ